MRDKQSAPEGFSASAGTRPPHRRPRPIVATLEQQRRQRLAWGTAVLGVVLVVAGLWLVREPLGERISHGTERARLLDEAARALDAGELTREDGRGARELYLAVLALDPDHQVARQGVLDTGRAALAEAAQAIERAEDARARAMLQLARDLNVPEPELARVQALRTADADDEQDLANLLTRIRDTRRGRTAHEALPLVLPLYERALALSPGHTLVVTSRSRLLGDVLVEAGRDVDAGDLEAAGEKIDQVAAADSAHVDLPGVRGRLSEAAQAVARRAPAEADPPRANGASPPRVDGTQHPPRVAAPILEEAERVAMLDAFDQALARQALLDPPGDSAWDRLRVLRSGAPDDPRVLDAERRYRESAKGCFEQHVTSPRLSAAEACLRALETLDPGDPRIRDASRRLAARWVGLAHERLGAAELAAAMRAYEAALERDPSHPDLVALAARLEQAGAR